MIFIPRCNLNIADGDGNTASHLAMLSVTLPSPGHHNNQYSNELQHVFESAHIERLTHIGVSPGNSSSKAIGSLSVCLFSPNS